MPDALIEFTEEPLMSRRQHHDVPTGPNQTRSLLDLTPVVLNMFENIQVQHAIEKGPVRERVQRSRDHTGRAITPSFGYCCPQPLCLVGIRFKAYPSVRGAVMQCQRCAADASADLKNITGQIFSDLRFYVVFPIGRESEQFQLPTGVRSFIGRDHTRVVLRW